MGWYEAKPEGVSRLAYEQDPDLSPYLEDGDEDSWDEYDEYDCTSDYLED